MTTTIRKCDLNDLEILQKLSVETYTDTFKKFNTPENLQAYLDEAYDLQVLKTELSDPHAEFYFLYQDKQLAGYLKINILDAQSETMGNDFLEIQRIYIRVPFKRHGFGQQLLDLALKRAHELGMNHIWLGVWENNFPAQKFYQHLGFERYSAHKFIMGDSVQTDYILKKELAK